MASSDDIKNAIEGVAYVVNLLKTEMEDHKVIIQEMSNHLMVSNIAHARNARANDISWKLNANSNQLNAIHASNDKRQNQENAIEILTP